MNPALRRLASSIEGKFAGVETKALYTEMYGETQELGSLFALLHQELDAHFRSINSIIGGTGHYWADASRGLLSVLAALRELEGGLRRLGEEFNIEVGYRRAIDWCESWLVSSGGSTVPNNSETIEIISFEPVFSLGPARPDFMRRERVQGLKLEGEGSYAIVHSYEDPVYGKRFCLKSLKRNSTTEEGERFRREFDLMSSIDFPYVVKAYSFDEENMRYSMEYCDSTLQDYIARNNSKLGLPLRKKMAQQFLFGVAHIHRRDILHRDLSLHNVLVREFDSPAVHVKIADFGLAGISQSHLTRTGTEMKGAIRDPQLDQFSKFTTANEVYAIGVILNFIFTGKRTWQYRQCELRNLVEKCTTSNIDERFSRVSEIIERVNRLDAGWIP